jgi:hypothetical protein
MTTLYEDPWIRCDETALEIHGYYFPLGTSKLIAYRDIQSVKPIALGLLTGRWRIWGTSYPGYWWHLDWSRPRKQTALVLDVGRPVRPVITPSDPDRVAAIIQDRHLH